MNLENVVDSTKCQVFLFASPLPLPLSFACHPWFLINKQGKLSRWEVWQYSGLRGNSWGHVYRDLWPPFTAMRVLHLISGFVWRPKIIARFEGNIALKLIEAIERSPETYPFAQYYSLFGPNSNTYAQWVLDQAGGDTKLSWRYVGKNFIKENSYLRSPKD